MPLELSPAGRRYGYHRDLPDFRDFGVGRAPLLTATATATDNLDLMGPVLDQGNEGSCTAHAAAADREYLHWKEIDRRGQVVSPGTEGMYSPSFIYYVERLLDGSLAEGDAGSYGRTSCMALNKFGCALRSEMPYVSGDFTTAPTQEQLDSAKKYVTGQYHRLTTVDDMKSCIASGYNFRIGFLVYQSFEAIAANGVWSPDTREKVLGGHEVLGIGYDDNINGGSFLVRNSWGSKWANYGNFWLRYSDAANADIVQDSWIQHLGFWK